MRSHLTFEQNLTCARVACIIPRSCGDTGDVVTVTLRLTRPPDCLERTEL